MSANDTAAGIAADIRESARAVLFDLDGTLVDSEQENAESIAIVLRARGRSMSDEERRFVVGHGWREIYALLAGNGGVDLGFDELKEAAAVAKEELCRREGLRVVRGAAEYVRAISGAKHRRCAIVSGSSRREIAFCIDLLRIGDSLDFYVGAEDVSHGKPSPEGYLLAARRLVVSAKDCFVFEDSTAGIDAARAAGMRCVAITACNHDGQDQSRADARIADFSSLCAAPSHASPPSVS